MAGARNWRGMTLACQLLLRPWQLKHGLGSLIFIILVGLAGFSCQTSMYEPDCGTLKFMLDGDVLGTEVSMQEDVITGEMTKDRILLWFPAPDGQGEWFLDFGYNSRNIWNQSERVDLVVALNKFLDGRTPALEVVLKGDEQDCDVDGGEICAGLGINHDGTGLYDVWMAAIDYNPAANGWVRFTKVTGDSINMEFDIQFVEDDGDVDDGVGGNGHASVAPAADEYEQVGSVEGCFSARRVFKSDAAAEGYWLE